ADDDASGTALVMELARVLNGPDVRTERSIRFALWNNEETGLNGSRAYVAQRAALQGKEDPPGSGRYPEPRWLGMIQHDMVLFDHGMPRADGTLSPEQRPEADVNIEFQSASKFADQALQLAFLFRDANEKYATDYPAAVGHHMTNTDSTPFMDFAPAMSVLKEKCCFTACASRKARGVWPDSYSPLAPASPNITSTARTAHSTAYAPSRR